MHRVSQSCHIDFSNCQDCPSELVVLISEIDPMDDFSIEIDASSFRFIEQNGIYTIYFDCGGELECKCNSWSNVVTITRWKC